MTHRLESRRRYRPRRTRAREVSRDPRRGVSVSVAARAQRLVIDVRLELQARARICPPRRSRELALEIPLLLRPGSVRRESDVRSLKDPCRRPPDCRGARQDWLQRATLRRPKSAPRQRVILTVRDLYPRGARSFDHAFGTRSSFQPRWGPRRRRSHQVRVAWHPPSIRRAGLVRTEPGARTDSAMAPLLPESDSAAGRPPSGGGKGRGGSGDTSGSAAVRGRARVATVARSLSQ